MSEMNTDPMGEQEEKTIFPYTPRNYLDYCCRLDYLLLFSPRYVVRKRNRSCGSDGTDDDPEFQRQMEELQMTLEAAE